MILQYAEHSLAVKYLQLNFGLHSFLKLVRVLHGLTAAHSLLWKGEWLG